jgi:predicted ATPase
MKGKLSLFSFRLKNFKAIQDSKTIKFTPPLTVLFGNNGSGKSRTLAVHIRNAFTRSGLSEQCRTTIAFVASVHLHDSAKS